ncbi:fungal-specific transcription factor domain-containing protein [Xylariales sp. AK1849]|nr:fungal-specific transcription factor domain-containing protein [Xylariales sp. AK1849]
MASQQATTQQSPSSNAGSGTYKRASRKGAPKKFTCTYKDCGKSYSRAEHLARHQLNHNPQQTHRCQIGDCRQQFVRLDLLERHQKRHSATYVPRNRASSFTVANRARNFYAASKASPTDGQQTSFPQQSVPRNASILLSPAPIPAPVPASPVVNAQAGSLATAPSWGPSMDAVNIIRPKQTFYPHQPAIHDPTQAPFSAFAAMPITADANELARNNFAMWLFDPQRNYGDLSMASMPFMEGGLESPFNNTIHYENESLTSRSQVDLTPPRLTDMPDELMSEFRRQEIMNWVRNFRQKSSKPNPMYATLLHEIGGDMPELSLEMLRDCVRHFWDHVSPRLPIVHQPTFSSSRCSIFLLLVMIALGAASSHSQDTTGTLKEYGPFADLVIDCVRKEILDADEASPPVDLWVAQALLLLEFYEKMISTRKLHERANIYHSVTLTLLRRGSPLIGSCGSESPPEPPHAAEHTAAFDAMSWWIRWANTEAMHRVVYAAFMMDVIHAAMFGHTADMAPHEIRLPLPCDQSLWSATSPEDTRRMEANLRMYGVNPVSFLDGLQMAIHGKEVQTHSFGRMIIMCGLLSVGWHLSHRETQLKWLELSSPSADKRDKWGKMLLKAFDDWKRSFDSAMGPGADSSGTGQQPGSNGLIQSAAILYHLAHISLHVDIVDCQVYAGAKRLLGRKISTRDYSNIVSRMRTWAAQPPTRHAVLHAFKLLHRVLVDPNQRRASIYQNGNSALTFGIQYSCRTDSDPHRPWIMYYATLTIWSFVRALDFGRSYNASQHIYSPHMRRTENVAEYLSKVARLTELDSTTAGTLNDGLPGLLDVVGALAAEAHSELLQEAHGRLEQCKELLVTGPP